MYTLYIPKEKMTHSFLFEYIDSNNKAQTIKSKKNCIFEIKKLILLTSVLNQKNVDISKKFTPYIYDISLYEEYTKQFDTVISLIKLSHSISTLRQKLNERKREIDPRISASIEFLIASRDKVFLRHGLEIFDKKQYENKEAIFPLQSASCWNDGVLYVNSKKVEWSKEKRDLKKNKIAFPIEIDMQPFCANLKSYMNRNWPKDPQYGHCSNHDSLYSWNKLKGYISYDDFKEANGKVIDSKRRDHLYACSDIPLDKWMFVYQNIEGGLEKSKYWGWTQKKFTPAQFKHSIHLLLSNGIHVVPQELIYELYKLR